MSSPQTVSTIVAVSTPAGSGGIAVIRLSGPDALHVVKQCWRGGDPEGFGSHTAHLGWITDSCGDDLDQVVVTVFKGPRSYTGEEVVEISCHGSSWIQQALVTRLLECGASPASAGEFTRRAFMNGRLDLAQAEGVADLIAASSKASARLAATQLKGDFSRRLEDLRWQLVDLGVLLELELDFSEEDVEFADRSKLIDISSRILEAVSNLTASFNAGNAFKNGVPVAIAGVPNAGKSTLLNAILGEDKAIVSDIPGTTRDVIEDTLEISGILFRFIDTAGIRESDDRIEQLGVERALKKISDAHVVVYLIDPTQDVPLQLHALGLNADSSVSRSSISVIITTKADLPDAQMSLEAWDADLPSEEGIIAISAKEGDGIEKLKQRLVELATRDFDPNQELIVTNARHYEALRNAREPLRRLIEGLHSGISADFLAQDLREAESYLGEITGAVSSSEILHSIFARYCIGK